MDTRERIVLYVIVLALAIAVVFLALTGNGGRLPRLRRARPASRRD